jgi:hypothetical protein
MFLEDAIEAEADAIADGHDAFVPAVMQHIEYAGIHSGDSACVIPPIIITDEQIKTIEDYTRRIAIEMKVVGLMNIQYAIYEGCGLYSGSQPTCIAHSAFGFKNMQHSHGQNCHSNHVGQKTFRFRP